MGCESTCITDVTEYCGGGGSRKAMTGGTIKQQEGKRSRGGEARRQQVARAHGTLSAGVPRGEVPAASSPLQRRAAPGKERRMSGARARSRDSQSAFELQPGRRAAPA